MKNNPNVQLNKKKDMKTKRFFQPISSTGKVYQLFDSYEEARLYCISLEKNENLKNAKLRIDTVYKRVKE